MPIQCHMSYYGEHFFRCLKQWQFDIIRYLCYLMHTTDAKLVHTTDFIYILGGAMWRGRLSLQFDEAMSKMQSRIFGYWYTAASLHGLHTVEQLLYNTMFHQIRTNTIHYLVSSNNYCFMWSIADNDKVHRLKRRNIFSWATFPMSLY